MDSETSQKGSHLKIPSTIDNPLDNLLYKLSDIANPYFNMLNMTPNMITTLSMVFTIFASGAIINNSPVSFVVLYLIAYFFDVADGSYARKYKMTSRFGDLYDHLKDVIGFSLICYIIFIKYRKSLTVTPTLILATFSILFLTHMGCEQKYLNDSNSSLNIIKHLCPADRPDKIRQIMVWSRHFGPGSFTLFFSVFVFWIMKCTPK
jgi:hypothetical protein